MSEPRDATSSAPHIYNSACGHSHPWGVSCSSARWREAAGSIGAGPEPLAALEEIVGLKRMPDEEWAVFAGRLKGIALHATLNDEARAQGGPSLDVERLADALDKTWIETPHRDPMGRRADLSLLASDTASWYARLAPADPVDRDE